MAHNEPPHLDLRCLPSSLKILNMIKLVINIFWKFSEENFVVCFLVINHIALKKAKIAYNFGLSECNSVKQFILLGVQIFFFQFLHCMSMYFNKYQTILLI